ncbi:MAG: restriction endonuclease subunit S [Oscillospiraceae bacterium]|nr:restriction endonuclease subunit S [Oscillospiraceae bacterium]
MGECADLLTGYPFESKSFSSEGILLIRGMNVKRNQLDCSPDLCEYWHTIEGLEKYLLAENDILIQMDGALIGKSYAKMPKNRLPALLVQRVTRARITQNTINTDFIYQCIQRNFLSYIKAIKTETAVPHLSLSDIEKFPIFLPTTAEQEAVGTYFRNLDNLITLHQRKYTHYVLYHFSTENSIIIRKLYFHNAYIYQCTISDIQN